MAQSKKKRILKARGKKPSKSFALRRKFYSANGVKKLKPAVAGNMIQSSDPSAGNY